jgi:hypothetical protein
MFRCKTDLRYHTWRYRSDQDDNDDTHRQNVECPICHEKRRVAVPVHHLPTEGCLRYSIFKRFRRGDLVIVNEPSGGRYIHQFEGYMGANILTTSSGTISPVHTWPPESVAPYL